MESWSLSKHKLLLLILLVFMVEQLQGVCIEDERKALLEIKASLHQLSYRFDVSKLLTTWVDHEITHGNCCDWERIKCDTATGYITDLSLGNMFLSEYDRNMVFREYDTRWPLNFSPFLRFKELRNLDLSWNFIDHTIVSTGLDRLSSLNKLEILNLSTNNIETNIFPLLGPLTSLKALDLFRFNGYLFEHDAPTYDISEFLVSENMEVLDLSYCGYYGTFQIQELSNLTNLKKLDLGFNNLNITPSTEDCKSLMRLERLESVSLGGGNYFNASIISCLSFLPFLNFLDLSRSFGNLGSSVSLQELSSLKELKELDLSWGDLHSLTLNGTMSKLKHLNLRDNYFKDDIMRSMAAFPSLRYLSLVGCGIGGRLFANDVPNMPYLQVLLLSDNRFNGTLPMEAWASFPHLKVLDLSWNNFVGSIPSTIKSLSSLETITFAYNMLNGSLPTGLCELKNLRELDLSDNMFDGNLPKCFNWLSYLETLDISLNQFSGMLLPSLTANLTSLKMFDISSNQFTGILPPSLIMNLKSVEYIDFGLNKFEGSFSFSSLSNHTKLEYFQLERDNEKLEVETEEPIGWIPMFQLKALALRNLNIKSFKGSVVPSFLLHQHKLQALDMAHNSLEGEFPKWLLENNTMLESLNLRNNSLQGELPMEYLNANMKVLDMSGNHITGIIHNDIQKFIPYIEYLNFSNNALNGVIPSSICGLHQLCTLDLSENNFSGGVPKGLVTNLSNLEILKLSKNALHGKILSGNLSLGGFSALQLDNNYFTGNLGNNIVEDTSWTELQLLDISDNLFTGTIPSWISNVSSILPSVFIVRNNRFEGRFPCGKASYSFLDISKNLFSGPLPYCLNMEYMQHLHLGSNEFTGLVPNTFRNLTNVLTLDIGHNYLSGRIPKFLGDLSKLRILLLGNNNFSGSIPKQLCKLTNVSLIDLSSNSLSGLIPRCLHYSIGPKELVFIEDGLDVVGGSYIYFYETRIHSSFYGGPTYQDEVQDAAQFTTKTNALTYKGKILDYMSGLDLSCNKLIGEIPPELGILTHILSLNLSHNKLTGPIPVNLSNLIDIESLDLSFNGLTGKVPSELIQLKYLAVFNVSYNNLSGKLPEWKEQFATFTEDSYEGNPLLCGQPLKNKCITESQMTHPAAEEGTDRSWYDIDMASFYGSFGSTWFVFMMGFVALIYINPYWRRRWLELVEECMFTCYYFLHDLVRKPSMIFRN